LIVVAIALIAWFAVHRPMPPDPIYNGRPLSQWVTGAVIRQGASFDDVARTMSSLDSNAVPWLIRYLQQNSRNCFDQSLLRTELRLARVSKGALLQRGLERFGLKDRRRSHAMALLAFYAPRTCFEENALRAILKSKSPLPDPDESQLSALASFTNRPDLVLPILCAGFVNRATREASTEALTWYGPTAVSNIYQMALNEPGANGPAASTLLFLDKTAWNNVMEQKQRPH
jgi:hypothetical protein